MFTMDNLFKLLITSTSLYELLGTEIARYGTRRKKKEENSPFVTLVFTPYLIVFSIIRLY